MGAPDRSVQPAVIKDNIERSQGAGQGQDIVHYREYGCGLHRNPRIGTFRPFSDRGRVGRAVRYGKGQVDGPYLGGVEYQEAGQANWNRAQKMATVPTRIFS